MSVLTETAPKRIFLCISDDEDHCDEPFPGDEVTWCDHAPVACTVEYVRADVAATDLEAARDVVITMQGGYDRAAAMIIDLRAELAAARGERDALLPSITTALDRAERAEADLAAARAFYPQPVAWQLITHRGLLEPWLRLSLPPKDDADEWRPLYAALAAAQGEKK